jgi:hypothetical protein
MPVFARVARWNNIPSDISSGVYLFQVIAGDEVKMGKFVVVR